MLDPKVDLRAFVAQVSRYDGRFLNGLHDHHTIEATYFFPKFQTDNHRVARGFNILVTDHHALDGHLAAFLDSANGVLSRPADRNVLQGNAASLWRRAATWNACRTAT